MYGVSSIYNYSSPILTFPILTFPILIFHGEGQTFSTSPSMAPSRVQAFEATNIRTFRRWAANEGGYTQDEEIRLKYGVDPSTGKIVVVGGEARAKIVKEAKSLQNPGNNGVFGAYSSSLSEEYIFENTKESKRHNAVQRLVELKSSLEQRLRKVDTEINRAKDSSKPAIDSIILQDAQNSEEYTSKNTNENIREKKRLEQERWQVKQKLDTVNRLLTRIKGPEESGEVVQDAAINAIFQSQKAVEKLLQILYHTDNESKIGENDKFFSKKTVQNDQVNKQQMSLLQNYLEEPFIPLGLLISEAA